MHERILNPAHIPRLLKIARATLFPNNAPGPPRKTPSKEEILGIKKKCARAMVSAVPAIVLRRYLGVGQGEEESMIEEVEASLDVLGDAYLNRHLMFNLVELIVVRLVPEMGERGVGELMRERIGEEKD